jgi:hypothetical protein
MTALNISGASEGADSTGLEELYTQIHAECIQAAIDTMNDGATKVTEAIKECWSGDDEVKFEENFTTFRQQVEKALNDYDTAIKNEFNSVFQQWIEFQASHVK